MLRTMSIVFYRRREARQLGENLTAHSSEVAHCQRNWVRVPLDYIFMSNICVEKLIEMLYMSKFTKNCPQLVRKNDEKKS